MKKNASKVLRGKRTETTPEETTKMEHHDYRLITSLDPVKKTTRVGLWRDIYGTCVTVEVVNNGNRIWNGDSKSVCRLTDKQTTNETYRLPVEFGLCWSSFEDWKGRF